MPRPVHEKKAELFRTLGHPVRIRVLEVLRSGEASVSRLAEEVGVGGSTLSQHLTTLRRAGVLRSRRDGSSVHYTVVDVRVFELLASARELLSSSLEADQDLLAELRAE